MLPDPRTKEYVPHLYLNANDHDYWFNRVILYPDNPIRSKLPKPTRSSHKSIDKAASIAARRVKDIIAGLRAEDQKERLFEWLDFIREKARIIWVTVPDENAAYIIFEAMNDRGLALSATDLLKNYLFSRADDQLECVKQEWFSMSGTLDSVLQGDILRNYVRHYWTSKYGVIRTQKLFGAIKKNVHTKQDIVEFVTDLNDIGNSALGNKPFAAKKLVLPKSKYALTSMVKTQTAWREKQVLERQAKLADLALKTWPLKLPGRKAK